MNIVALGVAALTLCAGFGIESFALMALAPLPLLVRLCAVAGEVDEARAILRGLFGARHRSSRGEQGSESLPELLEALRYRLRVGAETSRSIQTLYEQARASAEFPRSAHTDSPLAARLAALPCSFAVLARARGNASGSCELHVEGRHPEDPRFRARIKTRFLPYLRDCADVGFGVRDELLQESIVGSLCDLGIEYSAAYPIPGSGPEREVLWCGYVGKQRPREDELREILDFAKELGRDRETRVHLRTLSARASEAESGSREKSEFLAQLSHDMRSPLNNIRVILSLLETEQSNPTQSELVSLALGNCRALNDLIEDVLDLTRHGSGKLSAAPQRVEVGDLMREVSSQFAPAAQSKGLALEFEIDSETPCEVLADRGHLRRILSNLLGNAIKYTRFGSIRMCCRSVDSQVILVVEDSGCGMSELELERLFTPFTRFSRAGTEGVGLGLAVSKILVELNRGKILVSSQQGRGTRFEVAFPRVMARRGGIEQALLRDSPSDRNIDLSGLHVLIVDDEPDCVHSLARLLERQHAKVSRCFSVSEAVGLLNYELPDCIMSDASMPGGGVVRILRELKSRQVAAAVLVLSGDTSDERSAEYRKLGATAVFEKPAASQEILSWCQVVLEERNSSEALLQDAI